MGRSPAEEGAGMVVPGLQPCLASGAGGRCEVVPGREVEQAALGEDRDRDEGQEEEGDEPGDAEEGEHLAIVGPAWRSALMSLEVNKSLSEARAILNA